MPRRIRKGRGTSARAKGKGRPQPRARAGRPGVRPPRPGATASARIGSPAWLARLRPTELAGAAELKALRDALGAPGAAIATTRHLPVRLPFVLDPGAAAAPAHAALTRGPFLDPDGLPIWIDLLVPARKVTVAQAGVAEPALLLTSARLPRRAAARPYVIRLEAGPVWIRARLLDPAAPAGAYAGVRATGGTVTAHVAPAVAGDVVTLSQLELELAIEPEAPAVRASGPSGAAAAASVRIELPARAVLAWRGGALARVEAEPGVAQGFGQTFRFTGPLGGAAHVPALAHVVLPFEHAPASFDGAAIGSAVVTFAGISEISRGGWALPLTRPASPSALGEADGAGAWLLSGPDGLSARWLGATTETPLRTLHQLFGQNRFVLLAERTVPRKPPIAHRVALWPLDEGGTRRARMELHHHREAPLGYLCDAADGELLGTLARAEAAIDRPVTADGKPLALPTGRAVVALLERNRGPELDVLIPRDPGEARAPSSVVLDNAHLRVLGTAAVARLRGALDGTALPAGELSFTLEVAAWTPILPDPYVASIAGTSREALDVVRARVTATAAWQPERAAWLRFAGDPGVPLGEERAPSPPERRPLRRPRTPLALPRTQTEDGALIRPPRARLLLDLDRRRRAPATRVTRAARVASRTVTPSLGEGVFLLDVSTHRDLLGVQLGLDADALTRATRLFRTSAPAVELTTGGGSPFRLDGLAVVTPAINLRLFTVPQILWEPVRTLEIHQDVRRLGWFPTPLASATDGGPTVIASGSARLVPAVPDVAARHLVRDFAGGDPALMVTTLPFGMVAQVQLQPHASGGRAADTVALTAPSFPGAGVRGGAQLTMRAEGGAARAGEPSPTFEGATYQTLNGVDLATGAALGTSVLGATLDSPGSVEARFNAELAFDPERHRVPVTRFDVCGYGGSNFSDWANPRGALSEVTKVQFQVVMGRTALEIVKIASLLYPWGIRVTRTVTIERRGGGGVIRRDSGWKPASPGLFDFRIGGAKSPYVFHPGALRGCFDVDDIRPADGRVVELTRTGGVVVRLLPQRFDASVALDGLVTPDGARTVRATGLLGFLHLDPIGELLTPGELAALVAQESGIGGPLDALLDVGGSGLRLRALRVEVGLATEGTTPHFVGTVRGMPVFPGTGAWSAVRQATAGNPASPGDAAGVDERRGVPLIRVQRMADPVGDVMQLTGPAGDHRFADPEDLHAATPAHDYGFLQTTPTHSFLFRRPRITEGVPELRSDLAPYLADVMASYTSKGAFPPLANAIALPAVGLPIDAATGRFRLPAPIALAAPLRPRLQLSGSGTSGMALHYDRASLRLELDADRWRFEMPNLRVWADIGGMERLAGAEYHLVGGTHERSQARTVTSLIQEDLEDALSFLPGFADRGTAGPVDLDATNLKREKKIEVGVEIAPEIPHIKLEVAALVLLSHNVGGRDAPAEPAPHGFASEAKLEIGLEGHIPLVAPAHAIVGGKFEAGFKPGETELEIQGYFGIGVGGNIGPFKAEAYLGTGIVVVLVVDPPPTLVKVGGLVRFGAEVDLIVVSAAVEAELKGVFFKDGDRWMYEATGELAISVTVALFLCIEFSVEYTKEMEVPF